MKNSKQSKGLKLVKQSESLKDFEMKLTRGGFTGQCGDNGCMNCGEIGNDSTMMKTTIKWFWTPWPY